MNKNIIIVTIVALIAVTTICLFLLSPSKTFPPEHLVSQLPAKYGEAMSRKGNSYLISSVSVIPMSKDTVLTHQFVLIESGRIKRISSYQDSINTPPSTFLIDGSGKYLMPGLTDLHVHLNDDNNLLLMIANGVTTARNMTGHPFHLQLREKIENREILGPTLYTASPILESADKLWSNSIGLKNITEARDTVIALKKKGYDFIKIYHTLTPDLYRRILQVGDSINIQIVGHIPVQVELSETLSLSQYSIEHIDIDQMKVISTNISLEKKAEMIGASGKWVCPTLIVHENIQKHPDDPNLQLDYEHYVDKDTRTFWRQALTNGESEFELQKKLAKVMFDSGAKLLTGTDCLNSYVLAGFSLHEELQELVSAGLPEFEVLKGSTVSAAEFLKRKQDIGTIEVGKIADLILLEGNPLENILNTKRINGVMVKGKWFTADELDTMLADIRGSISN
jgi:hypothetical protein